MIACLAYRPLRLGNFIGLELGRHLQRRGDNWWLEIPAVEIKTRHAIALPFPVPPAPVWGFNLPAGGHSWPTWAYQLAFQRQKVLARSLSRALSLQLLGNGLQYPHCPRCRYNAGLHGCVNPI
jgi:hypothetical protein